MGLTLRTNANSEWNGRIWHLIMPILREDSGIANIAGIMPDRIGVFRDVLRTMRTCGMRWMDI